MRFGAGETVVIVRAGSRDAFGDPVPGPESREVISGVAVVPRVASREITDYRDTIITGLTAYFPPNTEITGYDTVERTDGTRWSVVGEPGRWHNVFTGSTRLASVEVTLERVIG